MTEILTLARKDLRLLFRDRAGFFFTFFWPVIMALFFGSIFAGGGDGGPRRISLMVVDQDDSNASRELVAELGTYSELEVLRADLDTAQTEVRRGAVPAYVLIPEGFGVQSTNRFLAGAPSVELRVDPSRFAEGGMLEGLLLRAGGSLLQRSFTEVDQVGAMVESNRSLLEHSPEFDGRVPLENLLGALEDLAQINSGQPGLGQAMGGGLEPLVVERLAVEVERRRGPQNYYAVSFAQAMLWAFLGCAASFGISLAIERSQGTLVRLRMSPLRGPEILAGKGVACFVTACSMSLFLIGLAVVLFGVRPLSWPLLMLAIFCTAICFVGIMMLLSVLGRTERAAAGIGWAILLVLAMFGGGMVPLFVMPEWMVNLSDWSPVKWGILAIEGAVWRGFTLQEMIFPCSVLLIVGFVTFALGARLFRWGELS